MATGIRNLPRQFQRNFELLKDLDQITEVLSARTEKLAVEYMSSFRNLSPEERVTMRKEIREAYGKWKAFSDKKLQIATESYEMAKKHIRQLDVHLAVREAHLKEKQTESNDGDSSCSKRKKKCQKKKKKNAAHDHGKRKNLDEEALDAVQNKLKFVNTYPEYGMPSGTSGSVSSSAVMNMAVDPREATRCRCRQVSSEEMISCDNPHCAIKWFHVASVGLIAKPGGKWFCQSCSQEQKKT